MKKRIKSVGRHHGFLCLFAACLLFILPAGCVMHGTSEQSLQKGKQDGLPARVKDARLNPGLSAVYFHDKFRHIDDMPQSESAIAKFGRPGPPILKLDHQFGRGEVFASGRSQEIGILMEGFIRLDKPGRYLFQAKSNDGFQLQIDGNLIVSDPGVHGARLSEMGHFEVAQGGVFPVRIKYFQRKGTAMLALYWQPPGESALRVVPAVAYSHVQP